MAFSAANQVKDDRTVWWVDASTRDTLLAGLEEVAARAGVPRPEVVLVWHTGGSGQDLLWRALNDRALAPWLLVVDNADDPSLLDGWIRDPKKGCTVLITSRDGEQDPWGARAVLLAVNELDEADSTDVLLELAPRAGGADDARRVARKVGGLPLVLTLVGKLLSQAGEEPVFPGTRIPRKFHDYERLLRSSVRDAIEVLEYGGRPDRQVLSRTWEMSLDLLDARDMAEARPILRLLSFFASAPIPVAALHAQVIAHSPLFIGFDDLKLTRAVGGLRRTGLLDTGLVDGIETLTLHLLVSETTRNQQDALESAHLYRALRVALLARITLDLDETDITTWQLWRCLLPHCTFTDVSQSIAADECLAHADVTFRVAEFAKHAGMWDVAESHYRSSLDFRSRALGTDHRDVLATWHNVAYTILQQGRLDDAEREYRAVLAVAVDALGPAHCDTLITRYELARLAAARGEVTVAEAEFRDLIPQLEQKLGEEDRITLTARYELMKLLAAAMTAGEAEYRLAALYATMSRALGSTDLLTLATCHEHALALAALGRLDAALSELTSVVADETARQGPDHPSTLVTQVSVVQVLVRLSRLEEAEARIRPIVAVWEQSITPLHHEAVVATNELGRILVLRGNPEGIETLQMLHAAVVRERGRAHPDARGVERTLMQALERR